MHSTNYTTIQNAINGGLDTANWASGKIFAPSKLMQEAATDKQFLQWNNGGLIWNPAGDWNAYTPAWTSTGTAPALLNGTITGKYLQIGKTVMGKVLLTMGSTTTFGTGTYTFSLPVTAANGTGSAGTALAYDTGVNAYPGIAIYSSATTVQVYQPVGTGAAPWTNTVPFTWGNTDVFTLNFMYEAA